MTAFEILPQPADARKEDNPWPQWPLIFRIDYGHEERRFLTGEDPRIYAISSKVGVALTAHVCIIPFFISFFKKNSKPKPTF